MGLIGSNIFELHIHRLFHLPFIIPKETVGFSDGFFYKGCFYTLPNGLIDFSSSCFLKSNKLRNVAET